MPPHDNYDPYERPATAEEIERARQIIATYYPGESSIELRNSPFFNSNHNLSGQFRDVLFDNIFPRLGVQDQASLRATSKYAKKLVDHYSASSLDGSWQNILTETSMKIYPAYQLCTLGKFLFILAVDKSVYVHNLDDLLSGNASPRYIYNDHKFLPKQSDLLMQKLNDRELFLKYFMCGHTYITYFSLNSSGSKEPISRRAVKIVREANVNFLKDWYFQLNGRIYLNSPVEDGGIFRLSKESHSKHCFTHCPFIPGDLGNDIQNLKAELHFSSGKYVSATFRYSHKKIIIRFYDTTSGENHFVSECCLPKRDILKVVFTDDDFAFVLACNNPCLSNEFVFAYRINLKTLKWSQVMKLCLCNEGYFYGDGRFRVQSFNVNMAVFKNIFVMGFEFCAIRGWDLVANRAIKGPDSWKQDTVAMDFSADGRLVTLTCDRRRRNYFINIYGPSSRGVFGANPAASAIGGGAGASAENAR